MSVTIIVSTGSWTTLAFCVNAFQNCLAYCSSCFEDSENPVVFHTPARTIIFSIVKSLQ